MDSFGDAGMRSLAANAVLFACCILSACGSGPEAREGDAEGGGRTAEPTPAESWATAQEKEATGDRVQSFGRIQWYQEAMLEYQWLLDHHPRASRAVDAERKIKLLRRRIDELKDWKRRADDFDTQSRVMMTRPDYLDRAAQDAAALEEAPFPFVRSFATERFEEIREAAKNTVERAFETLKEKVEALAARKEWPAAWETFGSFDPAFIEVFPEYGERKEALREAIEARAEEDVAAVLEAAKRRVADERLYAAVALLARARERFRGLPLERELRERERSLRLEAKTRTVEARTIESAVEAPPAASAEDLEPIPEPGEEPQGPAPGSHEEAVRNAMAVEVEEEVPAPAELFESAADPLAAADRWYYKTVEQEKEIMPGDEGYQKNLTRVIRMYGRVRELYVHLLEKNKKPDDAIEERLEKVQEALFWCKKNQGLVID